VIGIGSPIGKVSLASHSSPIFERFKLAVEFAEFFDAPFVRIFSYYEAFPNGRAEVLRRLQEKIDYVRSCVRYFFTKTKGTSTASLARRCLDLHQNLDSPKFRAVFDFANFVQAGEDPLANWQLLKPYTAHIHIKDALHGSGKVVPAGEGDGQIAEILNDACVRVTMDS